MVDDQQIPSIETNIDTSGPDDEAPSWSSRARAEKAASKANFRRKLIGVPLILLGFAMMAAGAYVWFDDGEATAPTPTVAGNVEERSTTTTSLVTPTEPPAVLLPNDDPITTIQEPVETVPPVDESSAEVGDDPTQ